MHIVLRLSAVPLGILALFAAAPAARAQTEYPPASGKAPVVIVVSGHTGAGNYTVAAEQIAKFGYDAVLLDANDMAGSHGEALKAAILKAQQSPHALPGKVGVIGFSEGGGISLGYATLWPDKVAVVIGWYPETSFFPDAAAFAARVKVPVLIMAGEADTYKNCCLIGTARALAAAAAAKGLPFELVTYPDTQHGYLLPGKYYSSHAVSDSWQRTAAKLKQYLGQ